METPNELDLHIDIDVTYEDEDEDVTAVMPAIAMRELLRQEAQLAAARSAFQPGTLSKCR